MDQLEARAKIVAILAHGAYRAELPNGHVCSARPLQRDAAATYAVGDEVRLAFGPADLSRARILSPRRGGP